MATGNLDERNLAGTPGGEQFHEDLLDKVWDISPIDLPYQDAIMKGSSSAHLKEWVKELLAAADPDNATIDGNDAATNDTVTGVRLGNYHQLGSKVVKVSDRARNIDTVGASDELLRQVTKRQRELRRDTEARLTSNKPAVAGDGTAVASECAGIGAWIATNTERGATGTDPTLSATTGGFPNAGPGAGTIRALSEALVRNVTRDAWIAGGNPTMAMSVPAVIEKLSTWLFDASARVAVLRTEAATGNRTVASSGNGNSGGGIAAQGSVNVLVTDFASLELVPNRFQPDSSAGGADLFVIDPELWELAFLQGYQLQELARTGTAENRQITVDYTLCSLSEDGSGVVADIDYSLAGVA